MCVCVCVCLSVCVCMSGQIYTHFITKVSGWNKKGRGGWEVKDVLRGREGGSWWVKTTVEGGGA